MSFQAGPLLWNKKTLGFLGLLLLASCTPHGANPIPQVEAPNDRFAGEEKSLAFQEPGQWWEGLGSKELNRYLEQVLAKSPALKASEARVEQRLALEKKTWATLLPGLGLEATRSKTVTQASGVDLETNGFSVALKASYELDLFGRNLAALKAAELDLLAALEDHRQQLNQEALSAAKGWLALAETRALLTLSEETLVTDQANLALIQRALDLGTAKASEVLLAQDQWLTTKLNQLQLKTQLLAQERAMKVRAGAYPTTGELAPAFPDPKALAPLSPGLPSELVKRRPDLRKAILALKAQDQRIGQAVADRFPRLSLTASTGYQSNDLSKLTDPGNAVWNLAANLTLPIFDGGGRRAEVKRQEAVFREQLASYGALSLTAFMEVEDGLFRLKAAEERVALAAAQAKNGMERLNLTRNNFLSGVELWSQVIQAQSQAFAARRTLIAEQRARMEARLDLTVALGGDWTTQYLRALGPQMDEKLKESP